MKKIILCLVFALSIFYSSATNVTGGIFSNATWTKVNSPYIVTDTVKVFGGATLTIQPGVVVKFNNAGTLINVGTLIANGTAADSIIFTSNSASPYAGIWNDIEGGTSFNYCRVSYSVWGINVAGSRVSHCLLNSNLWGIYSLAFPVDTCTFIYDTNGLRLGTIITGCNFIHNGQGTTGTGNILNCIFLRNSKGVEATMKATLISNCTFDSNYYALYFPGVDTIRNCTITHNNTGITDGSNIISNIITNNQIGISTKSGGTIALNTISDNTIGIETAHATISCNTLCNNSQYTIIQTDPLTSTARNNYWCLTDSAQIQATIYDGYNNVSLGILPFLPFDTVACTSIPASILAVTENTNSILIYPNPVKDELSITLHANIDGIATITNVLGQDVYTTKLTGNTGSTQKINTSGLTEGVYLLKIESNGQVLTKKVLKM
jgi:hypothetical protein